MGARGSVEAALATRSSGRAHEALGEVGEHALAVRRVGAPVRGPLHLGWAGAAPGEILFEQRPAVLDDAAHDPTGHLGMELDPADVARDGDRLVVRVHAGGQAAQLGAELPDLVAMRLVDAHAPWQASEQRIALTLVRELDFVRADLPALRIHAHARAEGEGDELVAEADAERRYARALG